MDALQVVLATGNAGKAKEFDRLLHPLIRVDSTPGLRGDASGDWTHFRSQCAAQGRIGRPNSSGRR